MALQVGELYGLLELDTGPFDKGISGVSGAFKGLGGIVTGAMAGIAAAVGTAMAGSVVAADNYKKALNNLAAQTGATKDEMASYGDSMKNIYAAGYGESFDEIANTMAYAEQATGAAGEELQYLAQDALMLRDTFEMDVTESLKASSQLMKQFGTTGTESMALIAEATQAGLNVNDDLIDSINEYSVYFQQAGLSAQDMFGIMESGMKAGAMGTDFIGDAFKEFGIIMQEDSTRAADALGKIGLNGEALRKEFAKGGPEAAAAFSTIATEVSKIEDPLLRSQTQVELFGTKAEDLGVDVIASFGQMTGSIKGATETLDEMNRLKFDSMGAAFTNIGRQLQVGFILPLGEKLLPYVTEFANLIAQKIPTVKKYFTEMVGGVQAAIKRFQPQIQGAIGIVESFADIFVDAFPKIRSIVMGVINFIAPLIMSTLKVITDWWNKNGQMFLENFRIVFNGILAVINFVMPAVKFLIGIVFDAIKLIIGGALQFITGAFSLFAGLFTGNWSKMWEGVKGIVVGAIKIILGFMSLNFVRGLLTMFRSLGTQAVTGIRTMWTKIVATFEAFINRLITGSAKMVQNVLTWFRQLWNQARTIFSLLRQFGEGIFRALTNTIRSTVSNMVATVRGNFTNLYNSIRGSVTNIWNSVTTTFSRIKTAMTNPINTAKNAISRSLDAIKRLFGKLKLKLPEIKVPSFSIKNWSMNPKDWLKAMPSIGVEWHKDGGIFNGPTVAGLGEAGPEAIVPLSGQRMRPFAQEIARQMGGAGGAGEIYVNATLVLPDGRVIAEIAEPHIQDIQDLNAKKEKRGWGAY